MRRRLCTSFGRISNGQDDTPLLNFLYKVLNLGEDLPVN